MTDYQDEETPETVSYLNENAYELLKRLVQLILPASAALYFGLSQIWGLPYGEQVVGSIALITTFLGVVLRASAKRYYSSEENAYDGVIVVKETEDKLLYHLELKESPEGLSSRTRVNFRVQTDDPTS